MCLEKKGLHLLLLGLFLNDMLSHVLTFALGMKTDNFIYLIFYLI